MTVIAGDRGIKADEPAAKQCTTRSLRRALVVAAVVDGAVLAFSVLVAWNLRLVMDVWGFSAGRRTGRACMPLR